MTAKKTETNASVRLKISACSNAYMNVETSWKIFFQHNYEHQSLTFFNTREVKCYHPRSLFWDFCLVLVWTWWTTLQSHVSANSSFFAVHTPVSRVSYSNQFISESTWSRRSWDSALTRMGQMWAHSDLWPSWSNECTFEYKCTFEAIMRTLKAFLRYHLHKNGHNAFWHRSLKILHLQKFNYDTWSFMFFVWGLNSTPYFQL